MKFFAPALLGLVVGVFAWGFLETGRAGQGVDYLQEVGPIHAPATVISGGDVDLTETYDQQLVEGIGRFIAEKRADPLNHPEIIKDFPGYPPLVEVVKGRKPGQIVGLLKSTRDPQVQRVILLACESLRARDYLELTGKILELRREGAVSKEIMTAALFPEGRLRNIFIDHYNDQQVRAILESAKVLCADDGALTESLGLIMDGSVAKQLEARRKNAVPKEAAPVPAVTLSGSTGEG